MLLTQEEPDLGEGLRQPGLPAAEYLEGPGCSQGQHEPDMERELELPAAEYPDELEGPDPCWRSPCLKGALQTLASTPSPLIPQCLKGVSKACQWDSSSPSPPRGWVDRFKPVTQSLLVQVIVSKGTYLFSSTILNKRGMGAGAESLG
ncbi:hypothetical protein UY3_14158 [Chelonia mydas]|uniref:Uncharacterized protein n=1 Tax=Chelonia mydas TaxID=8469 RepID=M7BKQ0_CHEMY|nr:hypothetical protein UY3_14158 [Chelonia mydas]